MLDVNTIFLIIMLLSIGHFMTFIFISIIILNNIKKIDKKFIEIVSVFQSHLKESNRLLGIIARENGWEK